MLNLIISYNSKPSLQNIEYVVKYCQRPILSNIFGFVLIIAFIRVNFHSLELLSQSSMDKNETTPDRWHFWWRAIEDRIRTVAAS